MNAPAEVIETCPIDIPCRSTVPEVFRVGPSLIHRGTRRVESPQGTCQLRLKEFELLIHLFDHATQTFSREALLQRVWNYQSSCITTRTVDQTVATLRKKIELDSTHPRFLQTVYRFGYRLVL